MKVIILLLIAFNIHIASAQPVRNIKADSIFVLDSLFQSFYAYTSKSIQRNGNDFYVTNKLSGDTITYFSLESKKQNDTVRLLRLMCDNGIVAIEFAGPGDCEVCSTYFFTNASEALVILHTDHHCYPQIEDCYWLPQKARRRKIGKNLYLVRNLRDYW
ncbi:hypothetical protein D3C71_1004050 [compost metagenome]